jgi:prolipoprotein diacylglyceryltransferase
MFGFSLPKLAVLIAIVLAVWYGFKILGRRRVLNNHRANNVKEKNRKQLFALIFVAILGVIFVAIVWSVKHYL